MQADFIVCSPPFLESLSSGDTSSSFKMKYPNAKTGGDWGRSYGESKGQLAEMKEGKIPEGASAPEAAAVWHDCYRESWKGIITEDSFAHPAKMAKGLLSRIFVHLAKRHGLKRGGYYWYRFCTRCPFVLELERESGNSSTKGISHEMPLLSTTVYEDQSNTKVLQPTVRHNKRQKDDEGKASHVCARQAMPPVQCNVSGEKRIEVLQQEVRLHLDISKQRKLSRRENKNQEGVRFDTCSKSSTGERGQICDGTPPSHGEASEKNAKKKRSSSPQERNQGRQSDRKSRSDDKKTTRQDAKAARAESSSGDRVPMLPCETTSIQTCPNCGAGLQEELRWRNPDLVLDCFAGIGSTGIEASKRGVRSILCELEPKFVALAKKNFARWEGAWRSAGLPVPVIVQGDSRRLRKHLRAVADCIVSSPPFEESLMTKDKKERDQRNGSRLQGGSDGSYGRSPGQLGSMPSGDVDAVVTSPPFEAGSAAQARPETYKGFQHVGSVRHKGNDTKAGYGQTDGQLGQEEGGTFWEAARAVVRECFAVLKPGGVAAFVCKDFVKKGKRVRFSANWRRLCESAGFVLDEWVKASLVKSWRRNTFTGGEVTKTRERKSFFRRIAEKKGSPKIDHEDVLFFIKPEKPTCE